MRNTFIDTIIDTCGQREDIFIVSGDAGLGVFDEFKEVYPERFLNLGVAEQNAISFSAGLSLSGHKVIVYNIIPFLLYRCYEQVRNDICYQRLPIILAGIGCGLTYAPQGMTHYSVEDIGIARSLPNLTIISPADPIEAKAASLYALQSEHPVYVRLAKRGEPNLHTDDNIDITQPQMLCDGQHVAIICHGTITEEVLKARDLLHNTGVDPRIITVPMLQPLDACKVFDMLSDMELVVSVEEHQSSSGLGAVLLEAFSTNAIRFRFERLGLPGRFIHDVCTTSGLRKLYGINANGIAERIIKIIQQGNSKTAGIKSFAPVSENNNALAENLHGHV